MARKTSQQAVTPAPTTSTAAATPMPTWVSSKVLEETGRNIESVQMLDAKGARQLAALFTDTGCYVAEKRALGGVKVYKIYFPEKFVLFATECPNCHEHIDAPFRNVLLRPKGAAEPTEATPAAAVGRYGGDNYPIIEIEGIGDVYANRLEGAGITTTHDLLDTEPSRIASVSQAPMGIVQNWYSMAELMLLTGIGKQYAELLVRSGIHSIRELNRQNPKTLLSRVTTHEKSLGARIQKGRLNQKLVTRWVSEAKKARRTARVTRLG